MHVDISSIYGEPEKYCLRCMLTQFLGSNEPTKETPIFELVMTNKESLKPYIYNAMAQKFVGANRSQNMFFSWIFQDFQVSVVFVGSKTLDCHLHILKKH